jgi:hypothetical protein
MAHNTATAMGSPVRSIRSEFPSGDMTMQQEQSILTIAGNDPHAFSESSESSSMSDTSDMSGSSDWGFDEFGEFNWTTSESTDGSMTSENSDPH